MPDAESDAPVEVVRAMVHLAETFGHTLPWANLIDVCAGIADADRLRWAVRDLVNEGAIEVTPKGLRFLLTEPPTSVTSPDETTDGTIAGHVMSCHTQRGNEGWTCTCPIPPGGGRS